MARSEARIQFRIWDGLEAVPAVAKLLYTVILTEPTVNHAGVGALRIDLWASNAGISEQEAARALAALEREPHVVVDRRTQEVLVRTLIRNDGVADQPYVLKGALNDALRTRSPLLRKALAAELRKLAPKRPDGVSKAGKPVVYPDPHAVADQLDPAGSPAPGRDPLERVSEGSRGPSDTVSQAAAAQGSGKGFETLGGGGRGGGRGLSPVTTQVEITDDACARELSHDGGVTTSTRSQGSPRPDRSDQQARQDLACRAVSAAIGTSRPKAVRDGLVRRAVMLLADGALGVDLTTALVDWRNTPDARISWLDHKVADAASRREAAGRPPQRPRSTTDERVQACLDRAAVYEQARAAGATTPAEQVAYAAAQPDRPPAPTDQALAQVIALPRVGGAW